MHMSTSLTWPDLPAAQQPPWPDANELDAAVGELRRLPPLVFAGECDQLTARLAQAARGEAFVLTGVTVLKPLRQTLPIRFALVCRQFCRCPLF